MVYAPGYPVQVQADNKNAENSVVPSMCMVYDRDGLIAIFDALTKAYLHVVAWDCDGNKVKEYDNR